MTHNSKTVTVVRNLIHLVKNIFLLLLILASTSFAQKNSVGHKEVFVDDNGIMRWKGSREEVSLFGVNYTTPFAYSYRAQKKLGLSLKKAIDLDVAQMARLGLDAFRVHVWDREISDKEGNIIDNEHLDLFDYLLSRLAANGIKIILTPVAWWGNGWPEPDEQTKGFSQFYSKGELITNPAARKAEENYFKQFVNHYNPYRKLSYKNDPSIFAIEIINEPAHPDNGQEVTDYINEMVNAVRNAGFTKPLFYNISQNWTDTPRAQAVCNANIQGLSFQWYPTDLVHNKMLRGNYLINVNHYSIPSDSLTGYNNKAKMVYEFEAADVGGSYMYPAMARSFREAGMQFATMFAYDPTQIAWSNTEYPTHYLNLLYTPAKAISLLIASRAFHKLPLGKSYGDYPQNNKFDDFEVNGENDLSVMNSDSEFYYSNSSEITPINSSSLMYVAGTGNSVLIKYDGTGAYFLDKIDDGIWKLEVYPDVLWLRDPFEPTSLSRQAARLYWNERNMSIDIPSLGKNFSINSLSEKKNNISTASGSEFKIRPGIYLLASQGAGKNKLSKLLSKKEKFIEGLYRPPATSPQVEVVNKTSDNLIEPDAQNFKFEIASDKKITAANLFIKRLGWRRFEKHPLKNTGGFAYSCADSLKNLMPGKLEYCVEVKAGNETYSFPQGAAGSPEEWDFSADKLWSINILTPLEPVVLFDAGRDRQDLVFTQFSPTMRYFVDYKNGTNNLKTALSAEVSFTKENKIPFGIQLNISDIIKPLKNNLNDYKNLVIKARTAQNQKTKIGLNILAAGGKSFSDEIELKDDWQEITIPISSFKSGEALIMPFSYPLFLKKIRNPQNVSGSDKLIPDEMEFIQIICDKDGAVEKNERLESGFEIESITLTK